MVNSRLFFHSVNETQELTNLNAPVSECPNQYLYIKVRLKELKVSGTCNFRLKNFVQTRIINKMSDEHEL